MPEVVVGNLTFVPWKEKPELLAAVVVEALESSEYSAITDEVYVSEIDPGLADTAEFCEFYKVGLEESANTIVVKAKRGDRKWYALCNILATTRADVNSVVRKHLDAKGVSFAPMDEATELTSMEYGGIGPIGAPSEWPFLIDSRVAESDIVIIGSGIRGSKIAISGKALSMLPNAGVIENMATPI